MRRPFLAITLVLFACDDKPKTDNTSSGASIRATPPPTASAAPASTAPAKFAPEALLPFQPVPEGVEKPVIDDTVKLGRMLYFDTRLSKGQDVSCNSCHDLAKGGMDGATVSVGTKKEKGTRNTPTILNTGGSAAWGWDARATTIEELVIPHIVDPKIMALTDDKRVSATIASIPGYAAAFKKAFPDEKEPITNETISTALATYVKKLFARSRWDKYLSGDKTLLTEDELAGVATFVEAGCTSCHQGKYIGASSSQRLGIAKPWPPPAGTDEGRFAVTKQEADRGLFKVPTLRNVTRTGPWLHDGSVTSLEEVTRLMSKHQVGKEISEAQAKAIVAFLGTLTGDPPKDLISKPDLPASGPKTPKPE